MTIKEIVLELERVKVNKQRVTEAYTANMLQLNEKEEEIKQQCRHQATHEEEGTGHHGFHTKYRVCDICEFEFIAEEDGKSNKISLGQED